jgi:hypothetical protein
MSVRLILAAAAAFALAGPALAQDAPAAPPAAAAVADPAEAAFQLRAEAFGARIETMAGEMRAATLAADGDEARTRADLDAIVARYQPEADAFAFELETFIAGRMAAAPEAQRAQIAQVGPMLAAQIRGAPAQARDQMLAAAVAAAAAPEAAPAPAPAQ